MPLPPLRRPKAPKPKLPTRFTPVGQQGRVMTYKPPKPYRAQPMAARARPQARTYDSSKVVFDDPFAGMGGGVQDLINRGTIQWDEGLGNIGYSKSDAHEVMGPQTDYGSLIGGDWEVQDAEAAMGSMMARSRGDFQAQLRSQLIDLGLSDTSKLGSLGKYIDADTIKAAVANKYSSTAQNAQQAARANAQNNASLAARGILTSGATTNAATQVAAGQEGANYQALRGYLEGGAAGLSGLADQEYQLARGVAAARASAAARAAEFGPGGEGTGFDQYGNPWNPDEGGGGAAAASQAAARRAMLTRRQFLARPRTPQSRGRTANQRYANYQRAYRRQNQR